MTDEFKDTGMEGSEGSEGPEESEFTPPPYMTALRKEFDDSYKALEPFRELRFALLVQIGGGRYKSGHHHSHHSHHKSIGPTPINMMGLAADIFMNHLAAKNPAVSVTSPKVELKVSSANSKLALNALLKEIAFDSTMQDCVLNALVGLSPARIGLNQSSTVEIGGVLHDVGQPFFNDIDLADWVHDISARTLDEASFCGHRYRMTKKQFVESGLFENVENVQTIESSAVYDAEDHHAHELSEGNLGLIDDKMDKMVELWDLWLPRRGIIVTIQPNNSQHVFREVEWDGPETGPYRLLRFNSLPGNIIPVAPFSQVLDLQLSINVLYVKLMNQAERQKKIGIVQSGATLDGKRVKDAGDGELIRQDDPKSVNEMSLGGIDQQNFMFLLQQIQLFSKMLGNLDVLGGLASQADTLGQEELLASGAGVKIQSMERAVFKFTTEVLQDLAYYQWTDPLISLPLVKRIGGRNGVDIPIVYTPESREGDFLDYNIRIVPFSMQHESPRKKLQTIDQVVERVALQMQPLMQEQGIVFDLQSYIDEISEVTQIDSLKDMFIRSTPVPIEQKPIGRMPSKSGGASRQPAQPRPPRQAPRSPDDQMTELLSQTQSTPAPSSPGTGIPA